MEIDITKLIDTAHDVVNDEMVSFSEGVSKPSQTVIDSNGAEWELRIEIIKITD